MVQHWQGYRGQSSQRLYNAGSGEQIQDEDDTPNPTPDPPLPNRTINIYEVAQAQEANTNVLSKPPDTPARDIVVSLGGFGLTQEEVFQLGLVVLLMTYFRRR